MAMCSPFDKGGTYNIALMAHVDAGKTTLTERLLFDTGAIRVLGSVDDGTAKTDDLAVERERGLSVRAAFCSFETHSVTVNLIDTPGHADFYSQVERAFLAVDAAVILVSADAGVQSGTEAILQEAMQRNVPTLFFINKCDRETARIQDVYAQLKQFKDGVFDYQTERYETAATFDGGLMDAFCAGVPGDDAAIHRVIRDKTASCELSPVFIGSARTGEGVACFLKALNLLAPPMDTRDAPMAGVVFSVTHDKVFGRGAYIRLYSGCLQTRDTIGNSKVTMIKRQERGRWVDARELRSGGIGLVYGLSECKTGDCIGETARMPPRAAWGLVRKPLLTARISSPDNTALKAALEMMTAEDPMLELEWAREGMHVNVMGAVQMETLPAMIEERFGIRPVMSEPEIIYKETLAQPAIGYDAYTMPKPCWAVLKFQLTPAERGSGVSYRCTAAPNRLPYRYRDQVALSIAPALKQGRYGWEVTDIDIDLVDGQDQHIHTHPLDFTIAAVLALADGLRNGGTVLLEPILDVKFSFDKKHLGRITGDILRMRGQPGVPLFRDDQVTLTALLPLASSLEYPITFASVTSGFGIMTQKLHGYRECPLELGKTRARRGVDPLDRSKYILAARNALSGTVFE